MRALVALSLLLASSVLHAQQPACYPDAVLPAKVRVTALPPTVSTRYSHAAVYTCATPTGYTNELWLFSWSKVANEVTAAALGSFDEAAARARCTLECTPATTDEQAFIREWSAPYRTKAVVSPSGTQTTRPVYALNPDGSRQTTAQPGARVAVGTACKLNRRIGSTSFFSVEGAPNVATADPSDSLGAVVAICSVVAPIGINL